MGYVAVSPAADRFGSELGAAINFHFEEHKTLLNILSLGTFGTKVAGTSYPGLCHHLYALLGHFKRFLLEQKISLRSTKLGK